MSGILSIFLIRGILIWQGIRECIWSARANDMKNMSYDEYHNRQWAQWKKKNGF